MAATLRYPANITDMAAYLIMVRFKHEGYGADADVLRNADKFQLKSSVGGAIALPMPMAFTNSTNIIWQDESDASIIGSLANAAISNASPKAGQELKMAAGEAIEKHSAMMFTGVAPKTFTYGWELAPRNASEAAEILNIVNELDDASLPLLSLGGESMRYPDIIKIAVHGMKNIAYLPCIINSVNVEYAPDGLFQMYKDGHVPNMRLSVTFTEITSRNRSVQQSIRSARG